MHKHKLKLENDEEEKLRLAEERRSIEENIENRKLNDHQQLLRNMQDRHAEETLQVRLKEEERKRVQQKHIEENKES